MLKIFTENLFNINQYILSNKLRKFSIEETNEISLIESFYLLFYYTLFLRDIYVIKLVENNKILNALNSLMDNIYKNIHRFTTLSLVNSKKIYDRLNKTFLNCMNQIKIKDDIVHNIFLIIQDSIDHFKKDYLYKNKEEVDDVDFDFFSDKKSDY